MRMGAYLRTQYLSLKIGKGRLRKKWPQFDSEALNFKTGGHP